MSTVFNLYVDHGTEQITHFETLYKFISKTNSNQGCSFSVLDFKVHSNSQKRIKRQICLCVFKSSF